MGQFGAGVWPPLCWRKATSPSMSAVSIGGEVGGAHGPFCRGVVDGPGGGGGHEHAFGVDPSVALVAAAADEDGARRAQGDQFVGIDGQIVRA